MTEREVLNVIPRIFHTINIHAQAEHRFSYTDPPLAQLPEDLEDLYIPDPGWPWRGWDWIRCEDYIIGYECQDEQFLRELREGWDTNVILAAELFDLPPPPDPRDPHKGLANERWRAEVQWRGKGDKRRKLGKNLNHALKYGKDPRLAHHMPGFKAAGIGKSQAIRAATRYLARYPRMLEWRAKVAEKALKTREVRDFTGRRWIIWEKDIEAIKRRAYNGPGQMGVSSIHNTVMVQIAERFGADVLFKWGKHDAQYWAVRESQWSTVVPQMDQIVEQEWDFYGRRVRFPAHFKEVYA